MHHLPSRLATTWPMASTIPRRPCTNFTGVFTMDAQNVTYHPWKTVHRCTMGEAYSQTLDYTLALKARYTVVEMWEFEFELLLKADSKMRDFFARVLV